MKIIYLITKILTYPGAFMKGFWEHITCRILKLEVTDKHYLSADWHCGHARHTPVMSPAKAFLLAFLPWFAQKILTLIFLAASVPPLLIFGHRSPADSSFFWLEVVALFLGLSLLCNSFPQRGDAKRLWQLFYGAPSQEEAEALDALQAQEQAVIEAAAEEEISEEEISEEDIAEEAEVVEADISEEEVVEEEIAEEEISEEAPAFELPQGLPKYAKLPAKILLAPANVYFVAGAWCERCGIPLVLVIAGVAAAILLR